MRRAGMILPLGTKPLGTLVPCAALAIALASSAAHAEVEAYASGMILRGNMTVQDADFLTMRLPRNGTLFLASPGGSLAAGLRIANLVSERRLTIVVEGDCVSACSLPFFAATRRIMKPGTRIGVHSSAKPDGREDDATLATTARIVRVLAEHGVPRTVVAGMMTAKPDEVYWLTDRELGELGVERPSDVPATAGSCTVYKIEAPAGYGRLRSAPSLSAPVVEQLANGSRIKSCSESRTDERGVVWFNVTALYRDEAGRVLEARGWISRLVLGR
jgi:hypothetical protein